MISIWHLIWIVPISAALGGILAIWLVIFDDFLWLSNDSGNETKDKDR